MDAKNLVVWALEASMYFAPRTPGLTAAELVEVGARLGLDADQVHFQLRGRPTDGERVLPFGVDPSMFGTYAGDLRTLPAFDHVVAAFNEAHRTAMGRDAWVSREAVVTAGEAAGLPRVDVEYAVAMFRAFDGVPAADDRWVLRRVKPTSTLPSAQRSGPAGAKLTRRDGYAELVASVGEVVERRAGSATRRDAPPASHDGPAATHDGPADVHAPAAEPPPRAPAGDDPVAAFGASLPALGQQRLVPWWSQLAAERRAAHHGGAALTTCLLAAWMTEGALTIACRRAGIPRPDPKATKPVRLTLTELARVATAIGLEAELRGRIEQLSRIRQRIQSTRLFDEKSAWSQLRDEDADASSATLEATLEVILAWHARSSGGG